MAGNDRISNSQLWIFMVLTTIGVGAFTLPRAVAETAGPDGWLATIVGGLIMLLDYYIVSRLIKRYPGDALFEMAVKTFGKVIAVPVVLIFWAHGVIIIAGTLRIFGEVVKMTLLIRTPIEVILLCTLVPALILVRSGIEPIVRFDEIVFPIIILTLFLIIVFTLPGGDMSNLLPFMKSGPANFWSGVYNTIYSYSGFEFVLLIAPFLKNRSKALKSGIAAFSIVITVYTLLVVVCYGRFGIAETKELIWPTLSVIKSVDVPGSFIERLEGVAMTAWVLFAFTTLIAILYSISVIPSRILGHKEFKHFCSLVIPVVYIIAMIPNSVVEVYDFLGKALQYIGLPAVFGVPVLLLIVSAIRRSGARKNA
jgi:spore germination protein (amino acid permease)